MARAAQSAYAKHNRLFADLALLGSCGDRRPVRLAQDRHHLLIGESALSHGPFLYIEEPSFQKSTVRKSRAGHVPYALLLAPPTVFAFPKPKVHASRGASMLAYG